MRSETIASGRTDMATRNPYAPAGWLALVQAALFPLMIFLGVVQKLVGVRVFDYHGPIVGPADLLGLLYTVIAITVLLRFKALLNERYEFRNIDTMIHLAIAWVVLHQLLTLGMNGLAMVTGLGVEEATLPATILVLGSFAVFALGAGVIDIIIAVRLLAMKDEMGDLVKAFAYVTLIIGILEATIFLAPLAALVVPIWCVVLALIFLKDKHSAEFV